ncbi:MAG: thiamine pyrophosphate-binding protein [Lachnospiraceae bacterium]|nr:thiamine pyrophosphate-binding protein [Lachnospiraceae bacterium]MCM1238773.1 thiamine pyrophosphate-binding protein [Lachnospiraceae bacterium]
MNCAEYLVDFLIQKDVTDVFGYSGGYIVPFMDALYKRRNEIKVHVCYNEQGCAYAADGFARLSGKMGVYFTTSGPGAVNGLGGLADAWFDGIPLMGICGNVPNKERKGYSGIRQNGFQEMDIVSITRNITKYSVTPNSAEDFPDIVSTAYNAAMIGRKGGVVIDFPYDIQKAGIVTG